MIIECKNAKSRLGTLVVNQAVSYATNKSADWVVVTNGHIWRLYRVIPVKGIDPRVVRVFDVSLLDADGISDQDVANLYLLSKRAIIKGETERYYHQVASLSYSGMIAAITSPRVVKSVRRALVIGYKKSSGKTVKLDDDDVSGRIRELLLPQDLSQTAGSTEGEE